MERNRQYIQMALFLIGFSAFGIFLLEGLNLLTSFFLDHSFFYAFVGIIVLFAFTGI